MEVRAGALVFLNSLVNSWNPRGGLALRGFFVSDLRCQNKDTEKAGASIIWQIKSYFNCWKRSMPI